MNYCCDHQAYCRINVRKNQNHGCQKSRDHQLEGHKLFGMGNTNLNVAQRKGYMEVR